MSRIRNALMVALFFNLIGTPPASFPVYGTVLSERAAVKQVAPVHFQRIVADQLTEYRRLGPVNGLGYLERLGFPQGPVPELTVDQISARALLAYMIHPEAGSIQNDADAQERLAAVLGHENLTNLIREISGLHVQHADTKTRDIILRLREKYLSGENVVKLGVGTVDMHLDQVFDGFLSSRSRFALGVMSEKPVLDATDAKGPVRGAPLTKREWERIREIYERIEDRDPLKIKNRIGRQIRDRIKMAAELERKNGEPPGTRAVGGFSYLSVQTQWGPECAVHSLFNNSRLKLVVDVLRASLRAEGKPANRREVYNRFLTLMENSTRVRISKLGLSEETQSLFLGQFGLGLGYIGFQPRSADELVKHLSLDGPFYTRLDVDSGRPREKHAVALVAAFKEQEHWQFVVLDSNDYSPKLYSFEDLMKQAPKMFMIFHKTNPVTDRRYSDLEVKELAKQGWSRWAHVGLRVRRVSRSFETVKVVLTPSWDDKWHIVLRDTEYAGPIMIKIGSIRCKLLRDKNIFILRSPDLPKQRPYAWRLNWAGIKEVMVRPTPEAHFRIPVRSKSDDRGFLIINEGGRLDIGNLDFERKVEVTYQRPRGTR